MGLLDDDLIDKIDIYLLKSRLIDYLKIHSWYDDLTDSTLMPVQMHYFTHSNMEELQLKMYYNINIKYQ